MPTPYAATGRTGQKQRTEQALLAAARDIVAEGGVPTIEQAAERAGISRTTAYRYLPGQRDLLARAHPETTAASLLPADPPSDVTERLRLVVSAFTELIVSTEPQQRAMLRLSLEPTAPPLPLRLGRAIGWIGEALEPLRGELGEAATDRLVLAVRATIGIEALVWLTDVAGLSRDAALALMRWSALSLLAAARGGTGPPT